MNAADRPSLQSSRRRNWRYFLLQEWSLLLLAAALTVIAWWVVRGNVLQDHTIEGVEVQLKIEERNRDRLAAVLTGNGNKVDLVLHCSKREKEQIEEQLKKDGWRVEMLVRDVPQGGRRPLNEADRYQWKFSDERVLKEVKREPKGRVFRLESREVVVGLPPTNPPADALAQDHEIQALITVTPPLVNLPLPVDAEEEPLTPDPIDLGKLLARGDVELDEPQSFILTFERWRSEDAENNPSAYRAQVELPEVRADVTLRAVGSRRIAHELFVMLDQKKYEYDLDFRTGVKDVTKVAQLTFTGTLRGPKTELDRLEEDVREKRLNWIWGVRVKERDKLPTKERPAEVTLSAEIVPVWLGDSLGRGVTFEPKGNQDAFDITVRWHPEHK